MATLPKTAEWVDEIDGVNVGDPVSGGESGTVNLRLASLAKRDEWLKASITAAIDEITALSELVGGINVSDALLKAKNLADIPNKANARANLGVATADHTHDTVYLKVSESLSDVPDPDAALEAIGAAAKAHTHEQYTPHIIGEYKLMSHAAMPAGWVKSNGGLYSIANYPKAFAIFGTKYGGDGLTTFAVPDWRADAVRINDDGRGIDSGRAVGSEQGDTVQNITGSFVIRRTNIAETGYVTVENATGAMELTTTGTERTSMLASSATFTTTNQKVVLDASKSIRTADETRMRNRSCYMYVYIGRPGIDA